MAQSRLYKKAYDSKLFQKLSHIETHGTGTKLGDPIEIDGIKAFTEDSLEARSKPIYLSSIKSHIGHLEACAGLASVLKVVLSMKHRLLPANRTFSEVNPYIDLKDSCLSLLNTNKPWLDDELVSGVSSFGFVGSNAHLVLSNYQHQHASSSICSKHRAYPILLSAKSEVALRHRIKNLLSDIKAIDKQLYHLADLSFTLMSSRQSFPYQLSYEATDWEQLGRELEKSLLSDINDIQKKSIPPLFSTQSSMARLIPLTPYTFDKEQFWFKKLPDSRVLNNQSLMTEKVKYRDESLSEFVIEASHPFLSEHLVFNQKVLPGVAHIEWMIHHLFSIAPSTQSIVIQSFTWFKPIITTDMTVRCFCQCQKQEDSGTYLIKLTDSDNNIYSSGEFKVSSAQLNLVGHQLHTSKEFLGTSLAKNAIYSAFRRQGITYGDTF